MADVRPFRALRPRADLAADVIAPPYDVLSEAEARALARNPRSFVRVTRSEVDLPAGADPHSDRAYTQARRNLDAFVADGVLESGASELSRVRHACRVSSPLAAISRRRVFRGR